MGVLIVGGIGIIVSLILLYSAYSSQIDSIENPDWMDRGETFIKQLILVVITFIAEMYMYNLLEGNSEIVKNTHSTPEFIRAIATAFFYMFIMYIIGKVYASMAGLIKD